MNNLGCIDKAAATQIELRAMRKNSEDIAEIPHQLNVIDEKLDALDEMGDDLRARLLPVLAKEVPPANGESKRPVISEQHSPLVFMLDEISSRIQTFTEVLESTINRIEL